MPAHQRVRAWIAQHYQKPAIDQEWLADCSHWIASEFGIDPSTHFDQFIQHVEEQLLQSNLADSTVPGSGIDPQLFVVPDPPPPNARRRPRQNLTTGPVPLLVEIKSITEIAHSAFSLLNTHQTRLDRADLGLAHDENPEQHQDEDEGPVPKFPRGMLSFELWDGSTTFGAIEFRPLPQLELGTTPLGYKLFLKSTPIRGGIAFLEPTNVVLKGYRTEDHDIHHEQVFLSSLRRRLGRPDPPPEEAGQQQANPPAHQERQPPLAARPPSPPDDMYADDDVDPDVLREMTIQMDEAINKHDNRRVVAHNAPLARPAPTSEEKHVASSNPNTSLHVNTTNASSSLTGPSRASSAKTSSYFAPCSSDPKPIPDIGLSPRSVNVAKMEPDIDVSLDDVPPKISDKKHGVAARPHPFIQAELAAPFEKRAPSPDPYDDLSFDMDMDDSFLEQVGMIEQSALVGPSTNDKGKGKANDTVAEDTTSHSRPSATNKKALPTRALTAEPSVVCLGSPPGAKKRRSTKASSSSSVEAARAQTRPSKRRLPRDSSLIEIMSSDDETPENNRGSARPLDIARGRGYKGKGMSQDVVEDSDVIDISD